MKKVDNEKDYHRSVYRTAILLITFGVLCFMIGCMLSESSEKILVETIASEGRELVSPVTRPSPTPTPQPDYLSYFMGINPISRETRGEYKIDFSFGDTDISDEVACAIGLLRNLGYRVDGETFIKNYVKTSQLERKNDEQLYGDHPIDSFTGDPRSDTGTNGCYVDVMMNAVSQYLWDKESHYTVLNLKNQSIDQLDDLILGRGVPVCIWTTLGKYDTQGDSWYVNDIGELFTWDERTRCMILTGYEGDYNIVSDPVENKSEEYATDVISANYDSLKRMAYTIVPKDANAQDYVPSNTITAEDYQLGVVDYHLIYGW